MAMDKLHDSMSAGGTGDLQFGLDMLVDGDNTETHNERLKQVILVTFPTCCNPSLTNKQEMDAWGEGIQDMTTDQSKPYAMMLASSKLYKDCERHLQKKVWDGIKMTCTFDLDRPRNRVPPKRIIVDFNERCSVLTPS